MLIVDTSVLIEFLRGDRNKRTDYLCAVEEQQVPYGIPLVCAQEVLQGALHEREWRTLKHYLISQQLLTPLDPHRTHFEAARIFFDCRRRGATVRSTLDCYIAQLVLESGGQLLHADRDFETIAKVRPLKFPRL